jgi:hypothetical protein
MTNLFRQFLNLLPDPALQVGDVTSVVDGIATVALPGGGTIQARGTATVGQAVFVRGGVIEGPAPSLTVVLIEV